ncbi:MAG: cytochrome c oxidase accessory protein CcoG [Bacteroidetes bacterium]|nr:MAG: cytochrome c oxidase accessory protein CcoG [Bacteroidota bacterium]TAF92619.1 MAG: cytochrome c oxidase accessory protein CcoG [Bacteroidota bacterium]
MLTATNAPKVETNTSFRDRISTVDEHGKRKWVYAYKPSGKFYSLRTWLSFVYFTLFFGLPFVYWNGQPLFLFNIPEAKFIIFGKIFWPQDFFIFGLTMVTFVFFIILFTAVFGRLFCGWACPQTNFMEMMFRKVEYFIVGDAAAQKQLNNSPWTAKKIRLVTVKHIAFYALSFLIANFFLAYIIGVEELKKMIAEPIAQHTGTLIALLVFSALFYAVYAFFREQACTVVCPYGRLQSVLLDKNSMIVAYDYKRGEPRSSSTINNTLLGDCINCFQCVKVCPTGIDIRNGLQMECVGCTACIDACNHVMEKIKKPLGLIRYASENSIASQVPLTYTTRMKLYTALCGVVLCILSALLISRKDIDATIIRTPGILFQERGADSISNLYNIRVANKTTHAIPLSVQIDDTCGRVVLVGKPTIQVKAQGQGAGSFFVVLPQSVLKNRTTPIRLALYAHHKKIATVTTNFLGPTNP